MSGRRVHVHFPATGATLEFAAGGDALVPFPIPAGSAVTVAPGGEIGRIAGKDEEGYRLADGSRVTEADVWPLHVLDAPVERLARGDIDPPDAFANRLDGLHLKSLREARGLGSYLGGRIQIFPHQLYVAERATRSDPVRWLLADEVGLGKTIEACLILNRLARSGRAERILIVAPSTLTVQWLGELYRKFHQVFALLDEDRRRDVARELGAAFNPFEAHARAIVPLEDLIAEPVLGRLAAEARYDLVIVDEAHRLERARGHPGGPAYRVAAPLVTSARHALLLTATPLESDANGFFRLLQLLRPDLFPLDAEMSFEAWLEDGRELPPCTSATRRADIGGLPPRVPLAVDAAQSADAWRPLLDLERRVRSLPAGTPSVRQRRKERYRRALASPAALLPLLGTDETLARAEAQQAESLDPRAQWLVREAPLWRRAGDKTLVFVAHIETLESLKSAIERATGQRVGIFHERLTPARADIEVAQFRLPKGPALLISTECGGEGRNFQFCKRLVLFDLPWNPGAVEQRIGRLDRIDRTLPVHVIFFRPPEGLGREVARLYEDLGVLREPLAGLEGSFAGIEGAIEAAAAGDLTEAQLASELSRLVAGARAVRTRIREAAWHELHREPYTAARAKEILERIPQDLESTTEEVVLAACEEFGFHVVPQRGVAVHAIEFGNAATIDHLPGVPEGSSFLGTFDRLEAVEKETIDFYASGHPLVEGVLQELEDGPRGQVALLQVRGKGVVGSGVLGITIEEGRLRAAIVDDEGRPRPEWEPLLLSRPLKTQRVDPEAWTTEPGWADRIRSLFERLSGPAAPFAVAAFRIVP